MDTSKEYIKMCDCSEIQEYRKKSKSFQVGDFMANYYLGDKSKAILDEVLVFEITHHIKNRMLVAWLPRQDQIQAMAREHYAQEMGSKRPHDEWFPKGDIGLGYVFNGFMKFASDYMRERYNSFEQLWLAFYMYEKHEKTWNRERWIKS